MSDCICNHGIRTTCPIHGSGATALLNETEARHRAAYPAPASEHFNQLRPDQLEALALLMEECAEVQQAIGKILRHGLYSHHPAGGPNNAEMLTTEVGDLHAAMHLAESVGLFHTAHVRRACDAKLERIGRYLHHIMLPEKAPQ